MNKRAEGIPSVAEIQGLYGPFSFSELLLQRIWSRCDFDESRAICRDGRKVRILFPGRWNRLGGPDFKDARLQIGAELITGDVEIHLHERDWFLHHHASDSAYDRVVLHVVLFPEPEQTTLGAGERDIPLLVLLPLLNHDLEEYAADDAVERLADHPLAKAHEKLTRLSPEELHAQLTQHAQKRWDGKVRYAKIRIERLGWENACHHTALEILGYGYNRAPMLAVAGSLPLERWQAESSRENWPAEVFEQFRERWSLQAIRPANHPRVRLRQYAAWVGGNPNWPDQLTHFPQRFSPAGISDAILTGSFRKSHQLPVQLQEFSALVTTAISGPRLNTLICDGFLPLLAARNGGANLGGWWFAWPAGDVPEKFRGLLRELGVVDRQRPLSHGILQGLLGWLVAADQLRQSEADSTGRGA
ncbi:MAG: DUF2851 family protein [Nibricoccus sp.]